MNRTIEAGNIECLLDRECAVNQISNRALNEVGINDPLAHYYMYELNRNDDMVNRILLDIETDIAERLPETPFVNNVNFYLTKQKDDFVSTLDNVSMREMTKNSADILAIESAYDNKLIAEYERAKTEAKEVQKIIDWFKNAETNSFLVFESLPIGEQKFAISRIYQKTSDVSLKGIFLSLHNPSTPHFNSFRESMGVVGNNNSEAEVLKNHYKFYDPKIKSSEDFIKYYVDRYDSLLGKTKGKKYSFGLEISNRENTKNGLEMVKSQPELTKIYTDIVKVLVDCNGIVTTEIIKISNQLGIDKPYTKIGQKMTNESIRDLLREVITGIASVVDKAADKLDKFNAKDTCYEAISQYGGEAKMQGQSYSSGGCPEFNRSNMVSENSNSERGAERNALLWAFGIYEKLDNFGKPKRGVCVVAGCPSRGESDKDKTTVGGCGVCICCHKLFMDGKSPIKIYKIKAKKRLARIESLNKNKQKSIKFIDSIFN